MVVCVAVKELNLSYHILETNSAEAKGYSELEKGS